MDKYTLSLCAIVFAIIAAALFLFIEWLYHKIWDEHDCIVSSSKVKLINSAVELARVAEYMKMNELGRTRKIAYAIRLKEQIIAGSIHCDDPLMDIYQKSEMLSESYAELKKSMAYTGPAN